MSDWLSPAAFSQAVAALPLVSVDLCVVRPGRNGSELLLGLRNNRPAQGWWFTPGGRVRRNERLASALRRVGGDELGLGEELLSRARLMGAWDHCYPDSAFDEAVSTHYVNLPHWLALDADEADRITLPLSASQPDGYRAQHAQWRWLDLEQAAIDPTVHAYVQLYAKWGLEQAG